MGQREVNGGMGNEEMDKEKGRMKKMGRKWGRIA